MKIITTILVVLLSLGIAACDTTEKSDPDAVKKAQRAAADDHGNPKKLPGDLKKERQQERDHTTKPAPPPLSAGQENALRAAEQYLDIMPFSQSGLAKQLQFDGFSAKDAQFAAANVGADWKEQAARSAQQYLDTMPFSRQGLIGQLEFDGYTTEQATYGVNAVGL